MMPAAASATTLMILVDVKVFWMSLPRLTPRELINVRTRMEAMANTCAAFTEKPPTVKSACASPTPGSMADVYLANAIATAAIVPVWMTVNNVQP